MILDTLLRPDLAEVVRRRMIEKRMTVATLARKAKVERQTIYNLLKGKNVMDRTLYVVAAALDLPVRDLLKEDYTRSAAGKDAP